MQKANASPAEMRKIVTKSEGAEILMLQIKEFAGVEKIPVQIQLIQIGPLSLIGVPGEPFAKTFLVYKERTKPRKVH
jgi:hypothetical protein